MKCFVLKFEINEDTNTVTFIFFWYYEGTYSGSNILLCSSYK